MPMIKRLVEPIDVTRSTNGQIPNSIKNELEYVANNTQANLIRQLSSLSQHAEDMFRELFEEASSVFNRTTALQNKVEGLRDSVRQFDPNQVIVKLTDITKRKPYKSDFQSDQQICTRETMPASLQQMYQLCKTTPRLDKFDKFRSDGMPSIKMYTNPDYFMQLWVESLQKNVENTKRHGHRLKKHGPSKKTRQRQLHDVQDRNKKNAVKAQGAEFIPDSVSTPTAPQPHPEQQTRRQSNYQRHSSQDYSGHQQVQEQSRASRPAPPAPAASLSNHRMSYQDSPDQHQSRHTNLDVSRQSAVSNSPSLSRMAVPPPPPPPVDFNHQRDMLPLPPSPPSDTSYDIVPPPPIMNHDMGHVRAPSPPPPLDQERFMPAPPPPPPMSNGDISRSPHSSGATVMPPPPPPPTPAVAGPPSPPPPPPPPATASAGLFSGDMLRQGAASLKTAPVQEVEPVRDERSELLKQIRLGIQLQRSEKTVEPRDFASRKILGGTFDVQSIMDKVQEMRRVIENSDDSDSDEYDDEDWDSP